MYFGFILYYICSCVHAFIILVFHCFSFSVYLIALCSGASHAEQEYIHTSLRVRNLILALPKLNTRKPQLEKRRYAMGRNGFFQETSLLAFTAHRTLVGPLASRARAAGHIGLFCQIRWQVNVMTAYTRPRRDL